MRLDTRRSRLAAPLATALLAGSVSWAGATWAAPAQDEPAPAATPTKTEPVPVGTRTVRGPSAAQGLRPGWIYRSRTFSLPANSAGGGKVGCGKSGYDAVSGGVQTKTINELLNESRPFDSRGGDRRPDNGWIGYVVNPADTATKFAIYVVCRRR